MTAVAVRPMPTTVPELEAIPERRWNPFPLAILLVTSAVGVLIVALAYSGARDSRVWADPLFWTGLLVIVLPTTLRLCGRDVSESERLVLVLVAGVSLYLVKVLLSPTGFTLHDELGQYRSVTDVLRTGSLYLPNPLVPAYAYYPGILTMAASVSRMSGLSVFASGLIIVGVARVLLLGGLFLLMRRITRSARVAGIAAILYAANPNFMFFDSQFAYESLALGFAAMTLWAVARVADDQTSNWQDVLIAAVLDGALVLSHHLTSYAVAVLIAIWALLKQFSRSWPWSRRRLLVLGIFSVAITTAYAVYAWPATSSDIGGSVTGAFHGLLNVITGASAGKAPFTAAHGYSDPPLEQVAGLASVALLLAALPFGLWAAWRWRPRSVGLLLLALVGMLYPLSLALRLTPAGTETSNRTSEFVFAGLAAVVVMAYVALVHRGEFQFGMRSRLVQLLATVYVGLVFVGGITVGTASYARLPAGHEVSAESRSIDPEGIAAAQWAGRWLAPSGHILADRVDTMLLTGYTRLHPQKGRAAGTPIGALIFDQAFGARQRRLITFEKLGFVMVDLRDSTAPPRTGRYFDSADPLSVYTTPIPIGALRKFDGNRCIDHIFSSGAIQIWDTQRILGGCQ